MSPFFPAYLLFVPLDNSVITSGLILFLSVVYYFSHSSNSFLYLRNSSVFLIALSIIIFLLILVLFFHSFRTADYDFFLSRASYVLRAFSFLIFYYYARKAFTVGFFKKVDLNIFYNFLVKLLFVSFVFEYGLRFFDLSNILEWYKARDLSQGGMSAYHYNRYSSFWNFPGDIAAIIVLTISLNLSSPRRSINNNTMLIFLVISLLLTDSRAGLVFLFFVIVAYSSGLLFKNLRGLVYFCIILSASYFVYLAGYGQSMIGDHIGKLFLHDVNDYIESSKRVQEYLSVYNSNLVGVLFGLPEEELSSWYEVEIIGSIARVGLFGSVWLGFFLFAFIRIKNNVNTAYLLYYKVVGLSFILIYGGISAGFSRASIGYFFVIFLILLEKKYSKKKYLNN